MDSERTYQSSYKSPAELRQERQLYYEGKVNETAPTEELNRELQATIDTKPLLANNLVMRDSKNQGIDLPLNPEAYAAAEVFIGQNLSSALRTLRGQRQHCAALENVAVGYLLPDEYRHMVDISYIIYDERSSDIVALGFSSEATRQEFFENMQGRKIYTAADLPADQLEKNPITRERLLEVQDQIFEFLKNHPACRERTQEFIAGRGWPKEVARRSGITYFDPKLVQNDLLAWAAQQQPRITGEELYLTGWSTKNFGPAGRSQYTLSGQDVIRIPFSEPDSAGDWHINSRRSRHLDEEEAKQHKYTHHPQVRDLDETWEYNATANRYQENLYEKFYMTPGVDVFKESAGKTIILTEGEFKVLVTEYLSNDDTHVIGIPGITEVSPQMIQGLAQAQAKEIVIILDADPYDKSVIRPDEITDSERAAWVIANQLKQAGANNVRIGHLADYIPADVTSKQGIDDHLLAFYHDHDDEQAACAAARAETQKIVDQAFTLEDYAAKIGLDPTFETIRVRRQRLGKLLEKYEIFEQRGGSQIDPDKIAEAREQYELLNETFYEYLRETYHVLGLEEPPNEFSRIGRGPVHGPDRSVIKDGAEILRLHNPRHEDGEYQQRNIICLSFVPEDTDPELQPSSIFQNLLRAEGLKIELMQNMAAAKNIEQWISNDPRSNQERRQLFERVAAGYKLLWKRDIDPAQNADFFRQEKLEDLYTAYLAWELSKWFPVDEYEFRANLAMESIVDGQNEQRTTIPLTVLKQHSGGDYSIVATAAPLVLRTKEIESLRKTAPEKKSRTLAGKKVTDLQEQYMIMRDWARGPEDEEEYDQTVNLLLRKYQETARSLENDIIEGQKVLHTRKAHVFIPHDLKTIGKRQAIASAIAGISPDDPDRAQKIATLERSLAQDEELLATRQANLENFLKAYGVTGPTEKFAEMIAENNLMYLEPVDLQNFTLESGLLNQLVHMGLYEIDKYNIRRPKFTEPLIVLPIKDQSGKFVELRIAKIPPLAKNYQIEKLRGTLGQSRVPEHYFYRDADVEASRGTALYIAPNECEAIRISSQRDCVIGLKGQFDVSDQDISRLITAQPAEIKLVLPNIDRGSAEYQHYETAAKAFQKKILDISTILVKHRNDLQIPRVVRTHIPAAA